MGSLSSPGTSGSVHIASQGANQTGQVTITDNAGNSQTFTSPPVSIDLTLPTVTARVNPTSAKVSKKPVTVNVSGTVTDALSGVDPNSLLYQVVDQDGRNVTSGPYSISSTGASSWSL